MANFYKNIKLSFRGNFPRINDMDEALKDPYHLHDNQLDPELNKPGDNQTSGFGTDYYTNKKPPVSSIKPEYATRPKWHGDFDGEDADRNDKKPAMLNGDGFYDEDSPLGIEQTVSRQIGKVDRDNTAVGPFNQFNSSLSDTQLFFDSIRRRLKN